MSCLCCFHLHGHEESLLLQVLEYVFGHENVKKEKKRKVKVMVKKKNLILEKETRGTGEMVKIKK